MKALFIGCGNMGAAIANGFLRSCADLELSVVDLDVERARSLLAKKDVRIFQSIDSVKQEAFDVTVLAIKPQQFHSFSGINLPAECGLFVSIMAGVTIDGLSQKLRSERIVRMMPNLPASVFKGMTVGFAPDTVSASDRRIVAEIFEGSGRLEWLEIEGQIDAATALAGSGPGYLFAFAQYLEEAAKAEGLAAGLADILVREMLWGAAELLHSDSRSALELKKAVTSKQGTTEAGLEIFEADGALQTLCLRGVNAARLRSEALSRKV